MFESFHESQLSMKSHIFSSNGASYVLLIEQYGQRFSTRKIHVWLTRNSAKINTYKLYHFISSLI